jgi:catechol 2,3-dioxygenase-like lactoylglutathione lyase family enzyme
MIKARRIGHATFETATLDRQIEYYCEVFGLALFARERGRAFLTTKIGQLAIALIEGERETCSTLSFEVSPASDFGEMQRILSEQGIKSWIRTDAVPGLARGLVFQDPNGLLAELFADWTFLRPSRPPVGIAPLKLGHVAFAMQDPAAIAKFYQHVLGFRTSDWIGDYFVFLRCGPDHHTVNFIRGDEFHMRHIAFELKDMAHIQSACEILGERRIPIMAGPLRHGPGHNVAVYHRNPADQVVEVYIEMDQMKDEELGYFEPRPWHHDRPQRPKVWDPGDGSTMIWGLPVPRYR